ncbi:MAG: uracil-xanthine permease [Clostridia bacterium]|nr:uracil-xanthine permease [Clostridia bacterium]MBQ2517332.1 uracil-xanthine permease [Clostridia bacterium]MBQ4341193.1 uracil-xanthine permease [Clostridia bacterium]MBR6429561.1 uracil-xanthine permease [Clostridia bacterium]
MNLIYKVKDRPSFGQTLVFAFQQLLAIMAATIAVPAIVGNGMTASAALIGAGVGTFVYQLFTKFRSPVFLGSSFAFLSSMFAAFAGAASMSVGYLGLIIGACFAGLVYVVIAVIVKAVGVKWINKLMPAVVIGPTVAIIGLSLAGNAVGDMMKGDVSVIVDEVAVPVASPFIALVCALVTLFVVILCSTYGGKKLRLIPFIIGILAGYAVALVFTLIGNANGIDALKIIDFTPFKNLVADGVTLKTFLALPDLTVLKAWNGWNELTPAYIGTIAVAYIPVAFVVFAEHIADHKNLSSIIGQDLLEDPGLSRTLLGDGVGSFVGAVFGGCPNTTYGESIGCVAITGNASVVSITCAAALAVIVAFISPFVAFLDSIPACVMGGVCMTLYGFIAVSGLKMLQPVDLNENRNLFVASVILIAGVGGLALNFALKGGQVITVTEVACALILGIITNLMLSGKKEVPGHEEPQQVIK